jgi:hypothetical protein
MLKGIHAQGSREAADRNARAIVDDLRAARMNTATDLVERCVCETLTYYAFPDIHRLKCAKNSGPYCVRQSRVREQAFLRPGSPVGFPGRRGCSTTDQRSGGAADS